MIQESELAELVDVPSETPTREYKAWLDLHDPAAKARIAKHICALANFGGGYLIFGINDDRTPATPHPGSLAGYNHNVFSGVVQTYLEPAIHCDVMVVRASATGLEYPVVRVPSHNIAPICGKKNGPLVSKEIQGIRQGVYYTRVPGPRSVPVDSAELWRPIIHRCVVNEREAVLASITRVLRGQAAATVLDPFEARAKSVLREWHETSHERFLSVLSTTPHSWPIPLVEHHYQLSFEIRESRKGHTLHNVPSFKGTLEAAEEAVKDDVWTGWSMFHQFQRQPIAPYIQVDNLRGMEIEVLEASHLGDTTLSTTVPDFWRVSLDGRATIIRPYREDRPGDRSPEQGFEPGRWLSPELLVRDIYEFVTFARHLLKSFDSAEMVEFRCSWWGLAGRRLDHPRQNWHPRTSRVNSRTTSAVAFPDELPSSIPEVAFALADPVLRLFDGLSLTADYVRSVAPRFRVLPRSVR